MSEQQLTKRIRHGPHTRRRTGCATCRIRRVKCDEAKPSCKRCLTARKICEYPLTARLPPRATTQVEAVTALQVVHEAEPFDWDFLQTIRYYQTVIAPWESSEFEPWQQVDFRYVTGYSRDAFTCLTIAGRISELNRTQGELLWFGERQQVLSGLWTSYSRYMGRMLRTINEAMKKSLENTVVVKCRWNTRVLYPVLILLSADLKVRGAPWQAHLKGYLAYMTQIGGMATILQHDRLQWQFADFIVRVIKSNSFTPANQQLLGYRDYAVDDLKYLVKGSPSKDMPCPADLLGSLLHITNIRQRAAARPAAAATFEAGIKSLFAEIDGFDADEWAKNCHLMATDMLPTLGRVFQIAVRLHAVMTLPGQAVLDVYPRPGSHQELRLQQRRELMKLLRKMFSRVKYSPGLLWPVVVAGVAAGASDAEAAADQTFVDECLNKIWWQPASMGDPFYCIEKLRRFWLTEETEWEECFYEPTTC